METITINWSGIISIAIAIVFILIYFIQPYLARRRHNEKCDGILYRSFTFNSISNIKCTKCDYDEDTIFPTAKDWSDVKDGDVTNKRDYKQQNN
jgi:hypothetical protein